MTEPFLYLISRELDPPFYCERAPVDTRDPSQGLWLVPMTSRILSNDRGFYTDDELETDKLILKSANANTLKNRICKSTDNEFLSVRSNKGEVPCAAMFMLKGRSKIFEAIKIDPKDYYIIFITADEVMFAEKSKYKPTQIKKVLASIKNKMNSLFPDASPVLSTAIFEYNPEVSRYIEV